MMDLIVSTEPKKAYDKKLQIIMAKQESASELMEYIDEQIQKAFNRGMEAGIKINTIAESPFHEDDLLERDAVTAAIEAGVNPTAFSNLYSREQGFKP